MIVNVKSFALNFNPIHAKLKKTQKTSQFFKVKEAHEMDRITHQVRLANWTKIIEQCNNRPAGTTAKQWLSDNGISDKSCCGQAFL